MSFFGEAKIIVIFTATGLVRVDIFLRQHCVIDSSERPICWLNLARHVTHAFCCLPNNNYRRFRVSDIVINSRQHTYADALFDPTANRSCQQQQQLLR